MIITHTISLPELLWTLWCIPGLVFLLNLSYKSYVDWKWLLDNKVNSIREYAAINNILIFSTMTLTQTIFVIAGLIAMMLPTQKSGVVAPFTYVITGLFMFGSLAKTVLALLISIRYRTLVQKIEEGEWKVTVLAEEDNQK